MRAVNGAPGVAEHRGRHGEVRHGVQARRGIQRAGDQVHGQRDGAQAARDLRTSGEADVWRSVDLDAVTGLHPLEVRVDLLGMDERNDRFARTVGHGGMHAAGDVSRLHRDEGRFASDL
jgi:hypothetical protein